MPFAPFLLLLEPVAEFCSLAILISTTITTTFILTVTTIPLADLQTLGLVSQRLVLRCQSVDDAVQLLHLRIRFLQL